MWLLEKDTFLKLQNCINGKTFSFSDKEHQDFLALQAYADLTSRQETIGIINVNGVLTNTPDPLAALFLGANTVYADIRQAIQSYNQDDSVESIQLNIDSPGGEVNGLFKTLDVIKKSKKPVKAVVSNLAASAAYAIASSADELVATERSARFGSVGVVASVYVDNDVVEITNTDSPDKRPDVTTEEGKASVRSELDEIFQLFAESIADGRNTTIDNVSNNFGKGAVLLADKALQRGMIDAILNTNDISHDKVNSSIKNGETLMDLNTLKAEHGDLYATVFDMGVSSERDRVSAHVKAGNDSGDLKTAMQAISDGSKNDANIVNHLYDGRC